LGKNPKCQGNGALEGMKGPKIDKIKCNPTFLQEALSCHTYYRDLKRGVKG